MIDANAPFHIDVPIEWFVRPSHIATDNDYASRCELTEVRRETAGD